MTWIAVAAKIVSIAQVAANMVEASGTAKRGGDKLDMAQNFAQQMSGICGQSMSYIDHPEVKEALKKYTEQYVNLQNVLAKVSAEVRKI